MSLPSRADDVLVRAWGNPQAFAAFRAYYALTQVVTLSGSDPGDSGSNVSVTADGVGYGTTCDLVAVAEAGRRQRTSS